MVPGADAERYVVVPARAGHDGSHRAVVFLIVDPTERTVAWLGLRDSEYRPIERSALIELGPVQLAEQLNWPVATAPRRRAARRTQPTRAILAPCLPGRILFSTDSCTYCEHAKSLLSKRGVDFEEVNLSEHPELQSELTEVTGLESFPQIVVNGEPLGGLNELRAADKNGVLRPGARGVIPSQQTFYDAVGGEPTFRAIVARFFAQVPHDEVLRTVYPLDDLDGAERAAGPLSHAVLGRPDDVLRRARAPAAADAPRAVSDRPRRARRLAGRDARRRRRGRPRGAPSRASCGTTCSPRRTT